MTSYLPLNVGTYNLRLASLSPATDTGNRDWSVRKPLLAAAVIKSGAKIVGLQEVSWVTDTTKSQAVQVATEINSQLGSGQWSSIGSTTGSDGIIWDDSVIARETNPITVLVNQTYTEGATRALVWAIFRDRATSARFIFACTHWQHNDPDATNGQLRRNESSQIVVKTLDTLRAQYTLPVVVVADFNDANTSEGTPRGNLIAGGYPSARDLSPAVGGDNLDSYNGFDATMTGKQTGSWMDGIHVSSGTTVTDIALQVNYASGGVLPLATPLPSDHNMIEAGLQVPYEKSSLDLDGSDIVANRDTTPVSRAHIYLPVFDDNSQLVREISVDLIDSDGNVVTPQAWTGPLPDIDQEVEWPISFSNGVIDLWLTSPGRFTVRAQNTNLAFSKTYAGVDVRAGADLEVLSQDTQLVITGLPEPGSWLRASDGRIAHWVAPPLIGAHQHQGAQTGSTVLNDATQTDSSPDQTWLGYEAGQGAMGPDTTVLGGSEPGNQSTVLGADTDTTKARNSTALGSTSTAAGQGSVLLGDNLSAPVGTEVVFEEDSTGVASFVLTATTMTLREGVSIAPTTMSFGVSSTAAVPANVTNAIMLQYPQVYVGKLRATGGPVQLAGASNLLSFFNGAGAVQTKIEPSQATGALGSLLSALRAYNLL